jgi:hypothetical protein
MLPSGTVVVRTLVATFRRKHGASREPLKYGAENAEHHNQYVSDQLTSNGHNVNGTRSRCFGRRNGPVNAVYRLLHHPHPCPMIEAQHYSLCEYSIIFLMTIGS